MAWVDCTAATRAAFFKGLTPYPHPLPKGRGAIRSLPAQEFLLLPGGETMVPPKAPERGGGVAQRREGRVRGDSSPRTTPCFPARIRSDSDDKRGDPLEVSSRRRGLRRPQEQRLCRRLSDEDQPQVVRQREHAGR